MPEIFQKDLLNEIGVSVINSKKIVFELEYEALDFTAIIQSFNKILYTDSN